MKKDIWFTNLSSPTIILPDGTHASFIIGQHYPAFFKTIYRAYFVGLGSIVSGMIALFADWGLPLISANITLFINVLIFMKSWKDIQCFRSWNAVNCIQILRKTQEHSLIVMQNEINKAKHYNAYVPFPCRESNEEGSLSHLNEKSFTVIKLPGVNSMAFYIPGKPYPSFFYSKFSAKLILSISIMAYLLMLYTYSWSWMEWLWLASSVTGILISIKDIKAFNEWRADNCVEIAMKTGYITDAASKK